MTVHDHGPEEGRGLACRERRVDGRLVGECIAPMVSDHDWAWHLSYLAQKSERFIVARDKTNEARKALIDPTNRNTNAKLGRMLNDCIKAESTAKKLLGYALQDARSFLESSNERAA